MSGRKKWSKASIATCGLRRGAGIRARATLERIGKLLANMDLLIAAHAAAVGAVLVTNDHTLEELLEAYRREADGQLGRRCGGENLTPYRLIIFAAKREGVRILRSFAAVPQYPAGSCGRTLVEIGISVERAEEER